MIDVTKPKFDPIPLPGMPGSSPSAGPRIGEPVPAPTPKSAPGPVLANKPDTPPAPAPSSDWVKEALGKLLVPTRTKAAILAAATALGGGMYAARLVTGDGSETPAATAVLEVQKPDPTPAGGIPNPTTPSPLPALTASTPPPAAAPSLTFDNVPTLPTPTEADRFRGREVTAPPVPGVELTRTAAPSLPDLTVPSVPAPVAAIPATSPTVPTLDVPALPGTGPIRTVDNTNTGSGVVVPAITGLGSPGVPSPAPQTTPPVPALGGMGVGGGSTGPATSPAVPSLTTPPAAAPVVPSLTTPPPTTPAVPSLTTPPAPAPMTPIPVVTGGGSVGAGAVQPGTVPVTAAPAPVTGLEPSRPTPIPVPATSREPETSFDVDVHTVRRGDTYAAISKSFYGDASFADALKMYDETRPGRTDGTVHVPPVWVLRKRYPQGVRNDGPVTPAATVPAERTAVPVSTGGGPDWNTARGTPKGKTYVLPRPMTMRDVAKEAFGDELYWNRVWDLNLNLSTDATLPAGTKVNLPSDSKVGQ